MYHISWLEHHHQVKVMKYYNLKNFDFIAFENLLLILFFNFQFSFFLMSHMVRIENAVSARMYIKVTLTIIKPLDYDMMFLSWG
jgi:hypothetical protein